MSDNYDDWEDENEEGVECLYCGWIGRWEELVCSEEDYHSDKPNSEIEFDRCPNCGSNNTGPID
jgi:DNA-directed RNA polymerase subunit RPC12/RpoP